MEHHTISKLSNDSTVSKFVTRKWIEANGLSDGQYSVIKNIRFKNPMIRSDLLNYNDACIVVKKTITVTGTGDDKRRKKQCNKKNNALFRSCKSKINNTFVDNVKDLDNVMLMYNL